MAAVPDNANVYWVSQETVWKVWATSETEARYFAEQHDAGVTIYPVKVVDEIWNVDKDQDQ